MTLPVNPSQIEKELKITLQRQSKEEFTGTKTSLFNLVIFKRAFSSNPSDSALDYLLGKRPARIIHIDSGYKDRTSASVFARCYPDRKDRSVCFEEILISNGPDNTGIDPGTWSSLLIHDIPTYIWWLDTLIPPSQYLFQSFELGDKLMIHSAYNSNEFKEEPLAIFSTLSEVLKNGKIEIPISDFSWGKILPLRKFIAKSFDRENMFSQLREISMVNIDGGDKAEISLLFLWLASRLKWTPDSFKTENEKTRVFSFKDRKGRTVQLIHNISGNNDSDKKTRSPHQKKPNDIRIRIQFDFYDSSLSNRLILVCNQNGCLERSNLAGIQYFKFHHDGNILLQEVDSLKFDNIYYESINYAEKVL